MGGNSSKSVQTIINNSVTKAITKTFQSVTTSQEGKQLVSLEANPEISVQISKHKTEFMISCVEKGRSTVACSKAAAKVWPTTTITGTLNQTIYVENIVKLFNEVKTDLQQNINNDMTTNLKQVNGLSFGNSQKADQKVLIDSIMESLTKSFQDVKNISSNIQELKVIGFDQNAVINLNQAITSITDNTLSSNVVTKARTKFVNSMTAELTQTNDATAGIISLICVILGAISIIFGILGKGSVSKSEENTNAKGEWNVETNWFKIFFGLFLILLPMCFVIINRIFDLIALSI
jgi:hypothetical protein